MSLTMVSIISINQKRLLEIIDISTFSNDVRGIILQYMHENLISKITLNVLPYSLHLGPHIVNNHLCIQITAYDDTYHHMLSSFGIDCEAKAVMEYNTLKDKLLNHHYTKHLGYAALTFSANPTSWEKVIFGEMLSDGYSYYYHLYAFCPNSQSTIRFRILQHTHNPFNIGFWAYTYDHDTSGAGKEYSEFDWSNTEGQMEFELFEDARAQMKICHELASIYGTQWHKHYKQPNKS